MKAVKATVTALAVSLALTVGGAVIAPPEPASANPVFPTSQGAQHWLWQLVEDGLSGEVFLKNFPFYGLDFSGFDFPSLKYTGINWSNSNFSGANLEIAQLDGGNFTGANLTRANLDGANLSGARLVRANLTGANLTGANLSGARLDGANLTGANLTGATLDDAYMIGATLKSVQGYRSATKKWTWYFRSTICPNGKKYGTKGANC